MSKPAKKKTLREKMAARRRKFKASWKKMGVMDRILILLGAFLLLFTIAMVWVFLICGSIPDTLVAGVYGACSVEGGIMGWIKNKKEQTQARKWELEDRKHMTGEGSPPDP